MADISKIIVDSLQYNIKDTNARDRAETLETNMARLDSNFSDLSDEVSEYSSDVEALDALVQANTQDISTLQSNKVSKSGDTMTGALTVNSTITCGDWVHANGLVSGENHARRTYFANTDEVGAIQLRDTEGNVKNAIYISDSRATCDGGFVLNNSYQIVTATSATVSYSATGETTTSITISVPSGYTAVAIAEIYPTNYASNIAIMNAKISSQTSISVCTYYYYNGAAIATTITAKVLCLRTS